MNYRGYILVAILAVSALGYYIVTPMLNEYHKSELKRIDNDQRLYEFKEIERQKKRRIEYKIKMKQERFSELNKWLKEHPGEIPQDLHPDIKITYATKCHRGYTWTVLDVRIRGDPLKTPHLVTQERTQFKNLRPRCWKA